MSTNRQQCECDERLLRGYLEDALSQAEQQQVEDHLCQCQPCRDVISDSAAADDWWSHAGEYLRGDSWDEGLDTVAFSSSATDPTGQAPECRHPLALRQIKQWLDPTDDPRMLGRFGGYEILGVIGQGGMGVVLKGFEPSLNRYVAIKVLAPLLASSGAARKRFAREAQATAAVLHDNVIPIHRVDEAHELPYLVMPYVSDIPLQKRIDDEGPLPLVAILRIGEQIASGLAAAHAHGLVHRDIKPANILLEIGVERVRITDFGLARAADDGSLTRTGVIAGTPQYMSPEQARGENVDPRSDLFSLGSVMYVMSTGRLPFRAETPYGLLRCITDNEPRSIREINPDIPAWLEAIIAKLHAKSLDARFASADGVARLLKQCLAHVQQPTRVALPDECLPRPTSPLPLRDGAKDKVTRHRWLRPALMVLAVVVVGGALYAGRGLMPQRAQPPEPGSKTLAPANPAPPPANPADDDPAIAWDATAAEIEQLHLDAGPFESQAHQLWNVQPMDSAIAPHSESPLTSAQEPKP